MEEYIFKVYNNVECIYVLFMCLLVVFWDFKCVLCFMWNSIFWFCEWILVISENYV